MIDIVQINGGLKSKRPQDVLKWALDTFSPHITLASSFGVEDVALIDMALKIDPKIRIFTLDTGRLNEETYEVMEKIREKYGVSVESYFPDRSAVEKLEREKGFYSFRESVANRQECCYIRKVEPLGRALDGMKAWITGLRREQSVSRGDIHKIEKDGANGGIAKINPLADWSEKEVWSYIKKNSVPHNKLHDLGYRSIGCEPCTRAVKPGEDIRAGRWWWENPDHKECGIHLKPKTENRGQKTENRKQKTDN